MFDGYGNNFEKIDIFDCEKSLKCSQLKKYCVTCLNATKKRLVEYILNFFSLAIFSFFLGGGGVSSNSCKAVPLLQHVAYYILAIVSSQRLYIQWDTLLFFNRHNCHINTHDCDVIAPEILNLRLLVKSMLKLGEID